VFLGHFAVAFAARRVAPRVSLGWLVAAPLFLDLLWPVFVLLGWERVAIHPGDTAFTPLRFEWYPWSHSLLTTLGWSALVAATYWWRGRDRVGTLVVAAGVTSHWLCDALVHRPDLPLYPGGPLVGLGLWRSVPGTLVLETTLFVAALSLYWGATRARDRTGRWALVAMVAFLATAYAGAAFGPPPPSGRAVAATALLMWLLPLWAAWIDRHRDPTPAPAGAR
jgi:membrane-bound metal-dependent hydrolase YbcI (DUF457 family)